MGPFFTLDLINRDRASRTRMSGANAMHPAARPRNASDINTGRVLFYHSSYDPVGPGLTGRKGLAPHLRASPMLQLKIFGELKSLFQDSFGFLPVNDPMSSASGGIIDPAAEEVSRFITTRIEDSLIGLKSSQIPDAIKAAAAKQINVNLFDSLGEARPSISLRKSFAAKGLGIDVLEAMASGVGRRGFGDFEHELHRMASLVIDNARGNMHEGVIHAGTISSGLDRISPGTRIQLEEEFLLGRDIRESFKEIRHLHGQEISNLTTHIYSIPTDSSILHPEIFRDDIPPGPKSFGKNGIFTSPQQSLEIPRERRAFAELDDLTRLRQNAEQIALDAERNPSEILYRRN